MTQMLVPRRLVERALDAANGDPVDAVAAASAVVALRNPGRVRSLKALEQRKQRQRRAA